MYSFYALLVLLFTMLVFQTRKVPQRQFKSGKILRCKYVVTLCGLLLMAVYLTLLNFSNTETIRMRFICYTVAVDGYVVAMCACLYLPPLNSVLSPLFASLKSALAKRHKV